ncbi:MAG TPA: YncE family protein [Gaiellaceae bacterium]|nr:YncE family protein [Gaiellaceae bacterium]
MRARLELLSVGLFAMVAVLAAPAGAGAAAHPQIRVGVFPTGIAVNSTTATIYVGNGTTGTLSLIDGQTCNARNTIGCGQQVTAVTAGTDPIGVAVDEATNTVYVVNASGAVAVVNGRRCDAANRSGCRVEPATVRVGEFPQFLAVDSKTHTIYVANGVSNTVSVIDGRTCNATTTSGCGRPRASVSVGPGPFALVVNEATDSVYVTDLGAPTVSVIDARTCNATVVRGCARRPATINVGQTPGGIALDTRTNTIYVTGESSDDVSVIDGKTCNARIYTGCRQKPFHVRAGAGARGIAVDEQTGTVYVANTSANTVSVIDGGTCNASVHSGCGQRAAVAPVGTSPRRVAVDERTNTVYVTNAYSNTVTMLNGRTCNGHVTSGCRRPVAVPGATNKKPSKRVKPKVFKA